MPLVTAWATLICGTLFMFLTVQVIRQRRASGVSIGDGGDALLLRRMRGQANAAEQMPLTLLALAMAEMMGGSAWILAPLAALFCGSRIAHGIGFGWMERSMPLRFFGMGGSLLATAAILAYLGIVLLLRAAS